MKVSNTTVMPWSTAIRVLCLSSRKKMKRKSLEMIIYFIILLQNTPIHTSMNPKIQKLYVIIIRRK
jgi:hypothetical protein